MADAAPGPRSAERVAVRSDLADVVPYGAPQIDAPVRLNVNEPPYPPPPAFAERLVERLRTLALNRYPDRRAWELRTALGERFGLPPERVWAANGSNEVLLQLFQAYGGARRRLLLFDPGYSAHPLIARVAATPVVTAELDEGFTLSPETAAAAVSTHDPDIVCVPRPNAPTGASFPLASITALHDAGRALVVLDEAYAEFADDDGLELLATLPRLVITRTFSKAWRMAGVRLGYLLAPDWVVDDLRRVRLPYHLDALTQAAGLAALELADEVTAHIDEVVAERQRLFTALSALPGAEVFDSAGNFLLLRTGVADVFERLLARGVLVRDFSSHPRLAGCVRVTIGTPAENNEFLRALEEAIR